MPRPRPWPTSRSRVLALCLALGALPWGCSGKGEHDGTAAAQVVRVYGKTLGGEYRSLEDFRGQVVLLNVWATWCEPCRQELPELARLHRQHKDEGFTVLGVSIDGARDEGKVRSMASQFALPFPILLDPRSRTVTELQVVGYPTTFVISRSGQIRWRRDGIITEHDAELATALKAALAEPVPEPAS